MSTGDYINNKPVDFLRLTSTKRYLNVHKSHVLNELTHRTEQGRSGDTQHAKEYINFLTQLSFESKGGIPPLRVIRGTSNQAHLRRGLFCVL